MSEGRTVTRPIQSCFQCRKRKIKCNRNYPCAPCLLRGDGDACREVGRDLSSKTAADTLDDVVHRVAMLEKTVSQLSRSSALGGNTSDSSSSPSTSTLPPLVIPGPSTQNADVVTSPLPDRSIDVSSPELISPDEVEAALILEDIAAGNRSCHSTMGRSRSLSLEGILSSPTLTAEQGMRMLSFFPKSPTISDSSTYFATSNGGSLAPEHPLSLLVNSSTNVVYQMISLMPDTNISRALVRFYFERIEWYTKVFHYPTFMSGLNHLSNQISLLRRTQWDVRNEPQISFPFLATYFMVLCLAYNLIDHPLRQTLGIAHDTTPHLAKKMYNAAQVCLWIDDFAANHSLESVQALILMGIYQLNVDNPDSHWALLGSGIKIAENLGLAHLGSESDEKTYSGSWSSVVKRETARRVWWNLVYGDWVHAAAHNGVYAIHPPQNRTGLPANINDIDLVDGRPLEEAPSTQYTEMTFSLSRFRFVEIHRQILDNVASPTGFGFIVDTDAKLRDILEADLPTSFQVREYGSMDAPSSTLGGIRGMEYTISVIMGETQRIRLHRPFLFRGYKDLRYAKSKTQCIASATAVLDILRYNPEQATGLLKWWLVMFYGFSAAIVLFIDYCHFHSGIEREDSEKRKRELQEVLNIFKNVQTFSGVSQNAVSILEGMMVTAEQRVKSISQKRTAPDNEDPQERVAKRPNVSGNDGMELALLSRTSCPSNTQLTFATSSEGAEEPRSPPMDFLEPPSTSFQPSIPTDTSFTQWPGPGTWESPSRPMFSESSFEPRALDAREWNILDSAAIRGIDDATIRELGNLLWTNEDPSFSYDSNSWASAGF